MFSFALVNDDVVQSILETEVWDDILPHLRLYQNVIETTDHIKKPQKGWKLSGGNLIPSVDRGTVQYVLDQVYDPLVHEFEEIRRQFIGENIFWGINFLNKTRIVGDFMEPIEKWFNRTAPIEAITEIEKAKAILLADQTLSDSLYPFVTVDRLNWYKTSILKAVAKTQG